MYVMHVMSSGHVKVYGKLIYLNVYIMVLIHTLNVNTMYLVRLETHW